MLEMARDIEFIIYSYNRGNFIFPLVICAGYPLFQLFLILPVGHLQCLQKHVGLFVLKDVAANLFSEQACIAIYIQKIILKLESYAQVFAELVEQLPILLGGLGNDGS